MALYNVFFFHYFATSLHTKFYSKDPIVTIMYLNLNYAAKIYGTGTQLHIAVSLS